MAFAREIFQKIKENIKFQQANKESDSHYTVLGNTLVRISNHCTYMYVWDNYFQENPKHEKMNILSIVFEDKSDTFNTNCSVLKHNKDRQIVVDEYVYPLHGNPQFLSKSDIKAIIRSLQNMMTTNRYDEPTGKAIYNKRKSINPTSQNISANGDSYEYTPEFSRGIDYVSESKNNKNKQDTNMKTENRKRNVVRLTESQLKQMITESVKKVLKEWNSDDDFICHGCKAWSNWGGIEMQISDGGDEARLRYPDGEITDWLEIEYDEEGVAYITAPNGEIERFDEYERVR